MGNREEIMPILVGGVGEKLSNNGTQWYQQNRVYSAETIAMAHCANIPGGSYMYDVGDYMEEIRIRKLTPKECYRLMGFDDASFKRASKVNSNSQLYRQAGNSIVVQVLMAIFGQMMDGKENEYKKDFDYEKSMQRM